MILAVEVERKFLASLSYHVAIRLPSLSQPEHTLDKIPASVGLRLLVRLLGIEVRENSPACIENATHVEKLSIAAENRATLQLRMRTSVCMGHRPRPACSSQARLNQAEQ